MISVAYFRTDDDDFAARAQQALTVLGARPGFVRGSVSRSIDDEADWILITEWQDVGSYRRALGNYEVKVSATPLLAAALDLPSGFETLADLHSGGRLAVHASDREPFP
jgi:hypothetical protein